MNQIFRPYLRKFILVFFYDILIYSSDLFDHVRHLDVVFRVLRENAMYLNNNKCQFAQDRVEYLGHLISAAGVDVDPEKLRAMLEYPAPTNLRELRGFLGLTEYYRRFVANYGSLAASLTQLLLIGRFRWSYEANEAFDRLKDTMMTLPVLALPDFTQTFIIECDASGTGLGAVLMKNQRPIVYYNHTLSSQARLKSVYERELMAVVFAVQRWRPYLLGKRFIIRSYQSALKFLLDQREIPLEYQQWVTKLLGYEFEI